MNIGAIEGDKPEDWYGLFFAWGETKGYKLSDKHNFDWGNYQFGTNYKLKKYNSEDNLTQLEKEDDGACQISNGEFRMPTYKEYKELLEHTTHQWIYKYNNIYKLQGELFTSKKDKTKSIFIPANGYCFDENYNINGKEICVWSSSINPSIDVASCLVGSSYETRTLGVMRAYGLGIRGILNK